MLYATFPPLIFPVTLCLSFPLHEFFFFSVPTLPGFSFRQVSIAGFFLEIVNLPSVIPNGLPLIIMAEFVRWRDEVNPVAIGQDGPTLPARWSRKKFSFLPYNIYLIDFMLYRIMPEL